MSNRKNPYARSSTSMVIGVVSLILFFVLLFFVARGIFTLLSWTAPVLLILALIIDHKSVIGFLKYLWHLLKTNPVVGLVGVVLTVIGYPVVAGFLFFKALGTRFIRNKIGPSTKDHFDDYEVVEDEEFLELPEINKPKVETKEDYEELFD